MPTNYVFNRGIYFLSFSPDGFGSHLSFPHVCKEMGVMLVVQWGGGCDVVGGWGPVQGVLKQPCRDKVSPGRAGQ